MEKFNINERFKDQTDFIIEQLNKIEDSSLELNYKVLMIYIRGSHMYGTNIDGSDIDICFIYQQSSEDILKGNFIPKLDLGNEDLVGYELERLVELLKENSPGHLEILDVPEDCILFKDESINELLEFNWITVLSQSKLVGFINSQLKKASGLNKFINSPQPEIRKEILEFCYVINGYKSIPFKEWFIEFEKSYSDKYDNPEVLNIDNWGLVKIPNGKELYAAFIDDGRNNFRGFLKDHNSTQLRLSSIPKEVSESQEPILITYNQNGFESHCKQHKSYWEWVNNRNELRYNLNQSAGQGIDLKNMMHLFRVIELAKNLAKTGKMKVKSDQIEFLLNIRYGKFSYKELLKIANEELININLLFEKCDFPYFIDTDLIKNLIYKFRMNYARY
jgi:predicted nucleotidyltransferase